MQCQLSDSSAPVNYQVPEAVQADRQCSMSKATVKYRYGFSPVPHRASTVPVQSQCSNRAVSVQDTASQSSTRNVPLHSTSTVRAQQRCSFIAIVRVPVHIAGWTFPVQYQECAARVPALGQYLHSDCLRFRGCLSRPGCMGCPDYLVGLADPGCPRLPGQVAQAAWVTQERTRLAHMGKA